MRAPRQLIHFDEGPRPDASYSEASLAWRARVLHLFSLMHAVAVQYLRDDLDLDNLLPAGGMTVLPAGAAAASAADGADGSDGSGSGSIGCRSRKIPQMGTDADATGAACGDATPPSSASRCITTGNGGEQDVYVDVLRDGAAQPRAAPPRLLRLAGAIRVVPTFAPAAAPHKAHAEQPLRTLPFQDTFILRWGPRANRRFNASVPLAVIGGVSAEERAALGATHARVRLVQSWVVRAMAERMGEDGGLTIGTRHPPTPILTRIYQLMSEATHAFAQARKIVECPFPFPHAHLVQLSLAVFAFTTPIMVVAWTADLWVALLMDAISVFSFFAMNEVACDLEDPFIGAPNNLPLAALHEHFNEDLCSYGWEYAALAQPREGDQSGGVGVGKLPPAAARAAAAARSAQGGGPRVGVEWSGSPYTAMRCYLVPIVDDADANGAAAVAATPAEALATLPPLPPSAGGVRRSLSAQAMRSPSPGPGARNGARPPSPAAALHQSGEPRQQLHFFA